jgi:hypothetical protein
MPLSKNIENNPMHRKRTVRLHIEQPQVRPE